ncbi:MAG: HipA N-terminal domain-containing protein [Verrucomicrobia bacterium]|nr:HipA N-terminal domain-containing protein [Verrucomicrobiota bacterium]
MGLKLPIVNVAIYLERRKTRLLVGHLKKSGANFVFTYDDRYLRARNVIPLGPEFPLTQREFKSRSLFPSLEDRIPSKQNPAYPEYCQAMGIDPQENDALILLSTIGKRGPSSFVFEPIFERSFTIQDVIEFRKSLNFSTREFAQIFEISQTALNALERKRSSGKDLLKRLEIIVRFPSIAIFFISINGGILPSEKREAALEFLKS